MLWGCFRQLTAPQQPHSPAFQHDIGQRCGEQHGAEPPEDDEPAQGRQKGSARMSPSQPSKCSHWRGDVSLLPQHRGAGGPQDQGLLSRVRLQQLSKDQHVWRQPPVPYCGDLAQDFATAANGAGESGYAGSSAVPCPASSAQPQHVGLAAHASSSISVSSICAH